METPQIDLYKVKELAENPKIGIHEASEILGISMSTFTNICYNNYITRTRKQPNAGLFDEIRELAKNPQINVAQASEILKISPNTVFNICRRNRIKWVKAQMDIEQLKELAANPTISKTQAKEILKLKNVSYHCESRNIEWIYDKQNRKKINSFYTRNSDKFNELAANSQVTIKQASEILGVSHTTIINICNKYNIKWNAGYFDKVEQLKEFAANPEMTAEEAAEILGIAQSTVFFYCKKYDIKWIYRDRRKIVQIEQLKELASDITVTVAQARQIMGGSAVA